MSLIQHSKQTSDRIKVSQARGFLSSFPVRILLVGAIASILAATTVSPLYANETELTADDLIVYEQVYQETDSFSDDVMLPPDDATADYFAVIAETPTEETSLETETERMEETVSKEKEREEGRAEQGFPWKYVRAAGCLLFAAILLMFDFRDKQVSKLSKGPGKRDMPSSRPDDSGKTAL